MCAVGRARGWHSTRIRRVLLWGELLRVRRLLLLRHDGFLGGTCAWCPRLVYEFGFKRGAGGGGRRRVAGPVLDVIFGGATDLD